MSFRNLFTSKKKPIKYFFNPNVDVTRNQALGFNQVLIVPRTYSEFINELKRYGSSEICTTTWLANSMAYRCNTCALNANMALCFECFDPEKHIDHDFYKFRTTTAEGKCDCGDPGIMRPEGFCDRATAGVIEPPPDLLKAPRLLLPEFVVKTFQMLIEQRQLKSDGVEYLMLAMLEDYADASVHLRDIIVSALVDDNLYANNFREAVRPYEDVLAANSDLIYIHGDSFVKGLVDLSDKNQITRKDNILDAVYLWAVKKKINATIFKFFVKLSANFTFKTHLAKVFSRTYIPVLWSMQKGMDFDEANYHTFNGLASQILTWSCQSDYLTRLKLPQHMLLYLTYILYIHENVWTHKYNFQKTNNHYHKFILYPIAKAWQVFFGNHEFLLRLPEQKWFSKFWTDVVVKFQGIEKNERILVRTRNPKNMLPYKGMNANFEVCMVPMLSLSHALKEAKRPILGTSLHRNILTSAVKDLYLTELEPNEISTHYSLFRILSLFYATDMHNGVITQKNFRFHQGFIKNLISVLIRIWAAVYEMLAIFWPHNGVTIEDVAKMYKVPHFTATTVDPDIFIVQLAATQLNGNFLTQLILQLFRTQTDLAAPEDNYVFSHQPAFFVDQVLLYFAILIASRSLAGENDDGSLRSEIICVLAIKETTKYTLLKMMPDRGINLQYKWLEDFDDILEDVATTNTKHFGASNEPRTITFGLKTRAFLEEYNPVLVHMRSVNMGGMEDSLANYYKSVEKENLNPNKITLWPPYRAPLKKHHQMLTGYTDFLHSSSFQALMFKILYNCMHKNTADNTLQIVIHLLSMSFVFPLYTSSLNPIYKLCDNCLIPYDQKFNVLKNLGLSHVFDEYNQKTPLENQIFQNYREGYEKLRPFEDFHVNAHIELLPPLSSRNCSDETILSLLLKLFEKHTKKHYKPIHMRGPEAVRYGSFKSSGIRIGGAEFFIGELLDNLVECNEIVLGMVEQYVSANSQAEEQEDNEEERKARLKRIAQEKKAKALAKMKKKQNLFKSKVEVEVEEETETTEEPEDIPQCCFCCKALFQDGDFPATVVFVTRTNMMGHRVCKPQPFMSRLNINTFAYHFQFIQALKEAHSLELREVSEWYDNLWVQSCGHQIHFSCYNKFIADNMTHKQQILPEHERYGMFTSEFWCPYCRQLCNGIFPLISTPLYARPLRKPRVLDFESLLSIINEPNRDMFFPEIYHIASCFSDLTQIDEIKFPFYASLFRNNLELMMMNKGLLSQDIQQNDFFPLKKLFKNVPTISIYSLCQHSVRNIERKQVLRLMQVLDPFGDDLRKCNIALADLKQLLVTTVIFLPHSPPELLKSIIYFFMNLHLLQLLSWMVVAADQDEIEDWIAEENLSGTQLEFIISLATNQFQDKIKRKQKEGENKGFYLQTLTDRLTEFVKFCVVLFYSVFNFSEALKEDLEGYDLWQLYDVLVEGELSGDDGISFVKCFGWDESTITLYSQKICREIDFVTGISKDFYMVREMMMVNWEPPKLVSLPDSFDEFLDIFEQKRLKSFTQFENPSDQSYFICLVCANYFTAPEKSKNPMKKLKHMERCGRGTCIVMDPYRNLVMIFWDKRTSFWDSIYMDEHGETNINHAQVTKMYMCPQRVHMLQSMWLFNSFDVFTKNWDIRFH